MNNMDIDSKTFDEYNSRIADSVWRYVRETDNRRISVEDGIQECWVAIMEYFRKHHKLPDPKLVSKICHDTCVSKLTRKDSKHNHLTYDEEENERSEWNIDDSNTEKNAWDEVSLRELRDMFEEGSKERTYLDFYLERENVADAGFHPPTKRKNSKKSNDDDGYTEGYLAKLLGFPSASSSSYRTFRNHMRAIIRDFYGR